MIPTLHDLTAAEFPLFAFSHCRDVVVAVSKAGGFGVLGAAGFTPEQLELELQWIDAHIGGCPYGVDVLIPEARGNGADQDGATLAATVSDRHRRFSAELLARHGVTMTLEEAVDVRLPSTTPEISAALLDVAFAHPIRLIVNALGIPTPPMIARARNAGVVVGALAGSAYHARRLVAAGVDILIAQGTEAGGHCGEVSTLVLLEEVLKVTRETRPVPVLAAGGIMTGRQMAGCMAIGAAGAWTGSIWLATAEAETSEAIKQRLIAATSADTVRSRSRTGKPSRQLRSPWHDAWDGPDSPGVLTMPQMIMVSTPAFGRIEAASAAAGEPNPLTSYFVGQGVGLIETVRPARSIVADFRLEFAEAVEALTAYALGGAGLRP